MSIQGQDVYNQLKKFIADNSIVGTAAGVIIALATKDVITSLVSDIIIPLVIIGLLKLNLKSLTSILHGKSNLDFTKFLNQFISWILIIIVTFIFIKITFEIIMGISSDNKNKKESFYSL